MHAPRHHPAPPKVTDLLTLPIHPTGVLQYFSTVSVKDADVYFEVIFWKGSAAEELLGQQPPNKAKIRLTQRTLGLADPDSN